jgi:hypothetical protein
LHLFKYDCKNSLDNKLSITFEVRKSDMKNSKNKNNQSVDANSTYKTIKTEIDELSISKNKIINLELIKDSNPNIKNYITSGLIPRDLRWNSKQLNSISLNFNHINNTSEFEVANKTLEVKNKYFNTEKANKVKNFTNDANYTNKTLHKNKISLFKANTNYKNNYLSQAKSANN